MRQLKITRSITNRETTSLDKYLQEIGRIEMITAEEEKELAQKIREGDSIASEKLAKANLRFVVSVAKQYQNQGLSLPDLINEGNLGLLKAVKRFDETRGFKFISYAVWWIRQAILQAIAEQSRIVRLPMNLNGTLTRISKEIPKLEQRFERDPTAEELSEVLELPEEKITFALEDKGNKISFSTPVYDSGGDVVFLDTFDYQGMEKTDNFLIQESLQIEIKRALATITERERGVINLYFGIGMNHGLTLEEIGEKFDLTRERVRQIKEKAMRRLRYPFKNKLLKSYSY